MYTYTKTNKFKIRISILIIMISTVTLYISSNIGISSLIKKNEFTTLINVQKNKNEKKEIVKKSFDENKKIKNNLWIEDVCYLEKNLPQLHANLFFKLKKVDFLDEIKSLKEDIPKLSEDEIRFRLKQIVANVNDAHTVLELKPSKFKYPFKLWWFNGDLKVIEADEAYKDILGCKLVAIDGTYINKIMESVNTLVSYENSQGLMVDNVEYVRDKKILDFFKITKGQGGEFTFQNSIGYKINKYIKPKDSNKTNMIPIADNIKNRPNKKPKENDFMGYWYEYESKNKILYFQDNTCLDRESAKKLGYSDYKNYPNFKDFKKELIKSIKHNDVEKFVIDMRKNSGGNTSLLSELIDDIKDLDINKKGKLFVIVGRETFSAAVINSLEFRNRTNAIFYGEDTGQNVNHYGEVKEFILPNSKLPVKYSSKDFTSLTSTPGPFKPDFEVQQSFDSYKNGIDEVYDAIKQYNQN